MGIKCVKPIHITRDAIREQFDNRFSRNYEKRLFASSRLSVLMQKLRSQWAGFSLNSRYVSIFQKFFDNSSFTKIWREKKVYFTWVLLHLWHNLAEFFLEWVILHIKSVEKIKTHILRSIFFLIENHAIWNNVEKYGTAGQVPNDNMAHAQSMLDN